MQQLTRGDSLSNSILMKYEVEEAKKKSIRLKVWKLSHDLDFLYFVKQL